jgi:hypothetical protein
MSWWKREVRERAEIYARLLEAGSEILDDTDGSTVKDFRHLLPGELCKRGLYLERRGDREVVTATPPWLRRRLAGEDAEQGVAMPAAEARRPVICGLCGRSWFECEHGTRTVIVAGRPQAPGLIGRGGRA